MEFTCGRCAKREDDQGHPSYILRPTVSMVDVPDGRLQVLHPSYPVAQLCVGCSTSLMDWWKDAPLPPAPPKEN